MPRSKNSKSRRNGGGGNAARSSTAKSASPQPTHQDEDEDVLSPIAVRRVGVDDAGGAAATTSSFNSPSPPPRYDHLDTTNNNRHLPGVTTISSVPMVEVSPAAAEGGRGRFESPTTSSGGRGADSDEGGVDSATLRCVSAPLDSVGDILAPPYPYDNSSSKKIMKMRMGWSPSHNSEDDYHDDDVDGNEDVMGSTREGTVERRLELLSSASPRRSSTQNPSPIGDHRSPHLMYPHSAMFGAPSASCLSLNLSQHTAVPSSGNLAEYDNHHEADCNNHSSVGDRQQWDSGASLNHPHPPDAAPLSSNWGRHARGGSATLASPSPIRGGDDDDDNASANGDSTTNENDTYRRRGAPLLTNMSSSPSPSSKSRKDRSHDEDEYGGGHSLADVTMEGVGSDEPPIPPPKTMTTTADEELRRLCTLPDGSFSRALSPPSPVHNRSSMMNTSKVTPRERIHGATTTTTIITNPTTETSTSIPTDASPLRSPVSFWGRFRERGGLRGVGVGGPHAITTSSTIGTTLNNGITPVAAVSGATCGADFGLARPTHSTTNTPMQRPTSTSHVTTSEMSNTLSQYSTSSSSSVGSSLLDSTSDFDGEALAVVTPTTSFRNGVSRPHNNRLGDSGGSVAANVEGGGGSASMVFSTTTSSTLPLAGTMTSIASSIGRGRKRRVGGRVSGDSSGSYHHQPTTIAGRASQLLAGASPLAHHASTARGSNTSISSNPNASNPHLQQPRIDTHILDDFETRLHNHYSVFSPDGVEDSNPPLMHYLHLGRWCTLSCEYFLHRFPAEGESRGHTVMWLHTARPRDRFVFLISPVEASPQQTWVSRIWRVLYGAPPNFALSGGRVLWNDGDREGAMVSPVTTTTTTTTNTTDGDDGQPTTEGTADDTSISHFEKPPPSHRRSSLTRTYSEIDRQLRSPPSHFSSLPPYQDSLRATVSALNVDLPQPHNGGGDSRNISPLQRPRTSAAFMPSPAAMSTHRPSSSSAINTTTTPAPPNPQYEPFTNGQDSENNEEDDEPPPAAPRQPHIGITALEVLHDDITAMDFSAQLMSSRLSLETKLATCRWFSSKEAALRHYDALDKLPYYTQVKSGGVSGVHMRQRMRVVQRLQARRKLERYMPRSGPAVGYPVAGVPVVRKGDQQRHQQHTSPHCSPSEVRSSSGGRQSSFSTISAHGTAGSASVFRVASTASQQHHAQHHPSSKKSICMGFSGDPRFSVNVAALSPAQRPTTSSTSPNQGGGLNNNSNKGATAAYTTSSSASRPHSPSLAAPASPPVSFYTSISNTRRNQNDNHIISSIASASGGSFGEPPPFSLSADGDSVNTNSTTIMGGRGRMLNNPHTTTAHQHDDDDVETEYASSFSTSQSKSKSLESAVLRSSTLMAQDAMLQPSPILDSTPSSSSFKQIPPPLVPSPHAPSNNNTTTTASKQPRRMKRDLIHQTLHSNNSSFDSSTSPTKNSSFPPVSPHVVSSVFARVQSRFGSCSKPTTNKNKGASNSGSNNTSSSRNKEMYLNTRPADGHVTSHHSNTMVVLYSQDPHFTHVLREVLAPESGTTPAFTSSKASQKRLLSLCEAGMPSWTIFFSRWGLPYRRWFRLLAVTLLNIWPLIALCVGAYDLYKHMPHLRNFMAHWFAPLNEWINENFALSISIYITYMMSVSLTVFQSLHSLVKTFTNFMTVIISPFAPLFATVKLIYPALSYLVGLVWALLSPFLAIGKGLVHLVLSPYYLIRYTLSFIGLFATPGAAKTVQSASNFAIMWRYWLDFWETVARPVKNLAKAFYDGIVHVGVAISKRDASLRLVYRATVPKLHRLFSIILVEWYQVLTINAKLFHAYLPHGTGKGMLFITLVTFVVMWNRWENSDAAFYWEIGGGWSPLLGGGSVEDSEEENGGSLTTTTCSSAAGVEGNGSNSICSASEDWW